MRARVVFLLMALAVPGGVAPGHAATPSVPTTWFLGGSAGRGEAIAVDTDGSVFVAGQSTHADVATNPDPQANDPCHAQAADTTGGDTVHGTAFVAKLHGDIAGALVCDFFTYLGGTGEDTAYALALDAGAIYVTGRTGSLDFQGMTRTDGADDAWVARLDQTGAVVWATYVGSSGDDAGYGIAVVGGNVYVSGTVDPTVDTSRALPMTDCAAQPAFGGGQTDAFVALLNAASGAIVRTTYLGGKGIDASLGTVAADASGVYVTGSTDSLDFPTTPGSVQPVFGDIAGGTDAFVTKFDPLLTTRLYSTFLGGVGADVARGITVDEEGAAYVVGSSASSFPTTTTTLKIGASTTTSTTTAATTTTSTTMAGCTVATTTTSTTVTSATTSTTSTVPRGLHLFRGGAGGDAFVAKIDAGGTQLVWATHIGGGQDDRGTGLAVDAMHRVLLAGDTASRHFTRLDAKHGRLTTRIYRPSQRSKSCLGFLRPCRDVFVVQLDANGLPCPLDADGLCPRVGNEITPSLFASLGGTGPDLQPQVAQPAAGGALWLTGITGADDDARCQVSPKPKSCRHFKFKPFQITVGTNAPVVSVPPGFPGDDAVDFGAFLVEIPQ